MRTVQISHPERGRHLAVVNGHELKLLVGVDSLYQLAMKAAREGLEIGSLASQLPVGEVVDYDPVYQGQSSWTLLPAFDHPGDPAHCLVTGTGLTHVASVRNRDAMHGGKPADAPLTDSMKVFQWGVEGGRPGPGELGVQPEWFFKGDASILRAHGDALTRPGYGEDGGEEPEIAGLYIVDETGLPWCVGYAGGNEFSDHAMEKRNYLYLAPSKLRECALGPEAVIGEALPDSIGGRVAIVRGGEEVWSATIATGEANMCHSIANLAHHHFKYPRHRRPGDAHIHFFGADAFSFGAGIGLVDGDEMVVSWVGFGRALINPYRSEQPLVRPIEVQSL
ncbi:MAG: AraD1 family protein [Opitutaceae bacterium]